MKEIIVEQNQSIIDIAVQEYGTPEGVFLLLEDNESIDRVDAFLTAGQQLKIREDAEEIRQEVIDYYRKKNKVVVNGQEDVTLLDYISSYSTPIVPLQLQNGNLVQAKVALQGSLQHVVGVQGP